MGKLVVARHGSGGIGAAETAAPEDVGLKPNTNSLREHTGARNPVTLQYNYNNLVRTVLDVLPMVLIPYL